MLEWLKKYLPPEEKDKPAPPEDPRPSATSYPFIPKIKGTDPPGSERRLHRRIEMRHKIMIDLDFAEGFKRRMRAEILDLSLGGLRLVTGDLRRTEVPRILAGPRRIIVTATFSPGIETVLPGIVQWVDFRDRTLQDRAHCFLGLAFDPLKPGPQQTLERLLQVQP